MNSSYLVLAIWLTVIQVGFGPMLFYGSLAAYYRIQTARLKRRRS